MSLEIDWGTAPATTGAAPVRHHDDQPLEDSHVITRLAADYLEGRYCWAAGLGWQKWSGTHWEKCSDANLQEAVRLAAIDFQATEARNGAGVDRLKRISSMLSAARIRALAQLARGILEVEAGQFDTHPNLLSAGNGTIDLRTGELLEHDPADYLSKHTTVPYRPGATHPDWTAALEALRPDVREWLQLRFGQAATGTATPDDILPVLQGGGANGKSTILSTIMAALGDHATAVPERVLLANPSDHPTEMMTLRGARLAVLEETPEARYLNVKRLKDVLGTETMTARHIARDTVSWTPTHSLFVATNYAPRVGETDHGTWRRLALVRFPYTYRKPGEDLRGADDRTGDPALRQRLKGQAQKEAVLAWLVDGAIKFYTHGEVLPPRPASVERDTRAWRNKDDLIAAFMEDMLVVDQNAHVLATELYRMFSDWCAERGHQAWSLNTFAERFAEHELVDKARIYHARKLSTTPGLRRPPGRFDPPARRYRAWFGVRYREDTDDYENPSSDEECPRCPTDSDASREEPAYENRQYRSDTLDTNQNCTPEIPLDSREPIF